MAVARNTRWLGLLLLSAMMCPFPPNPPSVMTQLTADGLSVIAVGGATDETTVVLAVLVSDPDGGTVQFEAEVKPVGTAFAGTGTVTSAPALSGTVATATVTGLSVGGYHWQVRTKDPEGSTSPWVSFGENPETDPDFVVVPSSSTAAPGAPSDANQYRSDGVTPVPVGGTTDESTMVFRAMLSDPDGDTVRLEIELRPTTTAFTGTPTNQSAFGSSGSWATVMVTGLATGAHHWQARAVDAVGSASAWVPFGGNLETLPDFVVNTALNAVPSGPADLSQHAASGSPPQAVGFTDGDGRVVVRGKVSDPDASQRVKLQVEVKPVGTAFVNEADAESPLSDNPSYAEVSLPMLGDGSYHWQARTVDSAGGVSGWVSFGGNTEADADFVVSTASNGPPVVTAASQHKSDGVTVLGVGVTTNEPEVVLKASAADPDGDAWQMEAEVRPTSVVFSGVPTAFGDGVVRVAGLTNGAYHWRVRAVDAAGKASAWTSFGGNADGTADFVVDTATNTPPYAGSGNQRRVDGSQISVGGATSGSTVVLEALVSDADAGQRVRFQAEVKPVGAAFDGVVSATSGWLTSGAMGQAAVVGLSPGSYRWRYRAVDTSGADSGWIYFGGNSESEADFVVTESGVTAPGGGGGGSSWVCSLSCGRPSGVGPPWVLLLAAIVAMGAKIVRRRGHAGS